ncbi:MAG: PKD domain-containing protein [Bacteroidota bacterium]
MPFIEKQTQFKTLGRGEFSGVVTSQGMLQFTSAQHVDQVTRAIDDLEGELEAYLHATHGQSYPNLARYLAVYDPQGPFKGINPVNGGPLPSLSGSELEKLDDDPIKYLFEEAFAHHSLRRYLIDQEYALLEAETFDGAGNDPDDHFIPDDVLRLLLNKNMEWKVENVVIKIVSATAILQVDDPATAQLEALRAEFAPPLTYTEIPDLPNPGICFANPQVATSPNVTVIDFMEPQAPQACAAGFTRAISSTFPTQVTFTNTSSGNFTSLEWNFGDGNVSTTSSPTHTYAQNGSYLVTLTLYDGVNICDAFSDQVVISSNCTADFSAVPASSNNLQISFSDYSYSTTGSVTSWLWDFGDGNTNSATNPIHTYSASGSYTACLTISTSDNCVEQYCDNIAVQSNACCKTNIAVKQGSGSSPVDIGNNRGYKGKLWITSVPFYRRYGSKTKCYRQKNNGNWVPEKADEVATGVAGLIYDYACDVVLHTPNYTRPKYDKKSVSWTGTEVGQRIRTKQEELGATFYIDDNGIIANADTFIVPPPKCSN